MKVGDSRGWRSAFIAAMRRCISAMARFSARVAVWWTAARGSVVTVIFVPPCKSSRSRALKEGRGRARNACAIETYGSSSRSTGASAPPSIVSIRSFRRSTSSRSGIGILHPRAEALQGAELQLFHGAFGLVQPAGNLADAPLLDEALD